MIIFLPATAALLGDWLQAGTVTATTAFAVTDALRRTFGDADDDDLEYHVLAEAGQASLLLAAAAEQGEADSISGVRRLVIVADVASAGEAPGGPPGAVEIANPIPWRRVTSLHADDQDALPATAAAHAAIRSESGAADDALDEVAGYELMWFDVTEARDVLALLDRAN